MVQINLIPDIKLELIRTQKHRNLIISISTIIILAVVGIIALLGFLLAGQWALESIADNSIKDKFNEYKAVPDVEKIVTIQNQLTKIDETHSSKPITSRLFSILAVSAGQGTDHEVQVTAFTFDKSTKTITVNGRTQSGGFKTAEIFKKNIEATKIYPKSSDNEKETGEAIVLASKVNLAEVGVNTGSGGDGTSKDPNAVNFQLSFEYNEQVFASNIKIAKITALDKGNVTDSYQRLPSNLFVDTGDAAAGGRKNGN